jgi:hypothetical protein
VSAGWVLEHVEGSEFCAEDSVVGVEGSGLKPVDFD